MCTSGRASRWWSQTGSNRRPPACKAGALPTELWPRSAERVQPQLRVGRELREMVGLGRFELPTSRLSSARSNQLSYKPKTTAPDVGSMAWRTADVPRNRDDPSRSRRAHGAGSSKKKEKRRRRRPANGHLRLETAVP